MNWIFLAEDRDLLSSDFTWYFSSVCPENAGKYLKPCHKNVHILTNIFVKDNPTIQLIITRAMDKISKFIIDKSVKSKEVIYSTATGWEVRGAYFGKTYTQALVLLFNGYRFPFPRVKRNWRGVYHSPPYIAEVKNEWSCTSISPICLYGAQRDKFFFNKQIIY
jgi:hypothetical protein